MASQSWTRQTGNDPPSPSPQFRAFGTLASILLALASRRHHGGKIIFVPRVRPAKWRLLTIRSSTPRSHTTVPCAYHELPHTCSLLEPEAQWLPLTLEIPKSQPILKIGHGNRAEACFTLPTTSPTPSLYRVGRLLVVVVEHLSG